MAVPLTNFGFHGLLGLALSLTLSAGTFVPPKEGPLAFRRDLLPIDVDTMISLSDELLVLAQGQSLENPEDRRNVARMLAVSSALNPANPAAREAMAKLAGGQALPKPEKRELNRSQARIWHTLAWLQMPEAGADGLALGSCLGDIISLADPDHPRAALWREAGEKGSWKAWVADLTAFQDAQRAEQKPVEDEKMAPEQPARPPEGGAVVRLGSATVVTPLWIPGKTPESETLQPTAVRMTAGPAPAPAAEAPPPKSMGFQIDHTPENGPILRMKRTLHAAMSNRFGKLPESAQMTLNLGEEVPYLPARDKDALSGAAAVLLGSALSGKEPQAVIIGKIEADGTFRMGFDFWDRLRSISKGPGGRLVIPTEAAEVLPAILALEEPEFFFRYDVFLASNLEELLDRSLKVPGEPVAELLARFQDVRSKSVGQAAGPYVANRFVRQRLVFLANEAPYYASPRLLSVQAAGERPTRLPKKLLAFELQRAIRPIAWIQGKPSAEIDIAELDKSYELARAEVEKLDRYADSSDKDFLNRVRDMTTTLRAFSRASRVGINRENGPAIVANAFDAMKKSYAAITLELKSATGQQDPAEPAEQTAE